MKLAILTPSRGRPKELYRFFDSINDTMSGQNEILFFFGIDRDDPAKKDYYDILHKMLLNAKDNMIVTMIEDDRKQVAKIWNSLARMRTWIDSPDYFIMGNDDQIYKTKEWDLILEEKIINSDHPFYLYWFDDTINGITHCSFPIVSKHWVGAMGYFVPECFKYFYVDTWIFDIATRANVLKYIPEVETPHIHFSVGAPFDKTYQDNRLGETNKKDTIMFQETENKRIELARIISSRIEFWKNPTPNNSKP
jgi:hypothetical protein